MREQSDHMTDLLRGVPLFEGMGKRDLRRLASEVDVRTFAAGKHLMMESHHGEQFLILVEGTAEVVRHGEVVAEVGPGTFLGEAGLMSGSDRNATVRTTSKAKVITMAEDTFRDLRARHPQVAARIDAEAAARRPS